MRMRIHFLTVVLLLLCTTPVVADECAQASGSFSTTAVTRIEYGPLGFMKIEFPESELASEPDKPLDAVFHREAEEERPETEHTRILDLGVFCLLRQETRGDEYFEQEWLDLPMVTTFAGGHDGERSGVTALDVPLFTRCRQEKMSDGEVSHGDLGLAAKVGNGHWCDPQ